ncbi:MAG: tetratricopeptide repeat protein [Gemmatimonadaceae bacterium]|jgi:tetratricopeptide (TPR) repeat protein|nr:tetratricopeptide repeat protein [Gemmatimonadaceae bacterium]
MSSQFLSSEEYDERAHSLYNEGKYDEALAVLREGLAVYPTAVDLHVGEGYARMAREEYAWARRAFDRALVLDGDQEDALTGLGEVLLKFGQHQAALDTLRKLFTVGEEDDNDALLQAGRALFREGHLLEAREFFEGAMVRDVESAEAIACYGYTLHRLSEEGEAIVQLERALALDESLTEARVYLANVLYDADRQAEALAQLEQTSPEDHWDELGIWRYLELKKAAEQIDDGHPLLAPWEERLADLGGELDPIDELLAEVEQTVEDAADQAKNNLELLGTLLTGLQDQRASDDATGAGGEPVRTESVVTSHDVVLGDGRRVQGSWDEIVQAIRDADAELAERTLDDFMQAAAHRHHRRTGVRLSARGPEEFVRASAAAGLLRILR